MPAAIVCCSHAVHTHERTSQKENSHSRICECFCPSAACHTYCQRIKTIRSLIMCFFFRFEKEHKFMLAKWRRRCRVTPQIKRIQKHIFVATKEKKTFCLFLLIQSPPFRELPRSRQNKILLSFSYIEQPAS